MHDFFGMYQLWARVSAIAGGFVALDSFDCKIEPKMNFEKFPPVPVSLPPPSVSPNCQLRDDGCLA
jgi:hypothetical protein